MTAPALASSAIAFCRHTPPCPPADAADHNAARIVFRDYAAGYSRLCNGVIVFDDRGELLPDGTPVAPRREPAPHVTHRRFARCTATRHR